MPPDHATVIPFSQSMCMRFIVILKRFDGILMCKYHPSSFISIIIITAVVVIEPPLVCTVRMHVYQWMPDLVLHVYVHEYWALFMALCLFISHHCINSESRIKLTRQWLSLPMHTEKNCNLLRIVQCDLVRLCFIVPIKKRASLPSSPAPKIPRKQMRGKTEKFSKTTIHISMSRNKWRNLIKCVKMFCAWLRFQ